MFSVIVDEEAIGDLGKDVFCTTVTANEMVALPGGWLYTELSGNTNVIGMRICFWIAYNFNMCV